MKNWKLVIIPNGDDTTGLYYENGNLAKKVKVRRYHEDEYSPEAAVNAIVKSVFNQKSEFNWDAFKNHKLSVRVKSPKDYENFLKCCEKEGLTWASGNKPTAILPFISYKENMIIDCSFCDSLKNRISWRKSSDNFHPKVPVVDWKLTTEVEPKEDELKEGDLVEVIEKFMSCPKGLRGHIVTKTEYSENEFEVDFHVNYGFTHKCNFFGLGKELPQPTGYYISKSFLKKVK
jgi:hypothetical protein